MYCNGRSLSIHAYNIWHRYTGRRLSALTGRAFAENSVLVNYDLRAPFDAVGDLVRRKL